MLANARRCRLTRRSARVSGGGGAGRVQGIIGWCPAGRPLTASASTGMAGAFAFAALWPNASQSAGRATHCRSRAIRHVCQPHAVGHQPGVSVPPHWTPTCGRRRYATHASTPLALASVWASPERASVRPAPDIRKRTTRLGDPLARALCTRGPPQKETEYPLLQSSEAGETWWSRCIDEVPFEVLDAPTFVQP